MKGCELDIVLELSNNESMILILVLPKGYLLNMIKLKQVLTAFKAWGGTAIEVDADNKKPDHILIMERLFQDFCLKVSVCTDYNASYWSLDTSWLFYANS